MVRDTVRALWAEPRAPHAPRACGGTGCWSPCLVPRRCSKGSARRRRMAAGRRCCSASRCPGPCCGGVPIRWPWSMVAFGAIIVTDLAVLVGDADGAVGLYTMAFILLLPYSLFRWGSGREIGIGLALILVAASWASPADYTGVGDSVAGLIFLLFPAALGASVRYWTSSRLRELDQVKLREREQLARELHDTVAHHVSAIAIRAQAGRVVAATHPARRAGRPRRDRGGGVADTGRDAHHGRRAARRRRRRRSPRSPAWPTSSGSPAALGERALASRSTCRVTSTTSGPRSGRRSTGSPRSR